MAHPILPPKALSPSPPSDVSVPGISMAPSQARTPRPHSRPGEWTVNWNCSVVLRVCKAGEPIDLPAAVCKITKCSAVRSRGSLEASRKITESPSEKGVHQMRLGKPAYLRICLPQCRPSDQVGEAHNEVLIGISAHCVLGMCTFTKKRN